ncbi:hypothetical protein MUK42_03045 [Musa troglodytarum]|uniref:Uncharacterized protein n=1 Tax=Musa troglodytarum TaxID=320322 RepID=A0A9E7K7A2_9LILI|nr:hypothetical protein MUK42_03045 [Musa troglodytarum]
MFVVMGWGPCGGDAQVVHPGYWVIYVELSSSLQLRINLLEPQGIRVDTLSNEWDTNSAELFLSTSGISFCSRGFLLPIANSGLSHENVISCKRFALPYIELLWLSTCFAFDVCTCNSGSLRLPESLLIPVVPLTAMTNSNMQGKRLIISGKEVRVEAGREINQIDLRLMASEEYFTQMVGAH